MGRKSKKDQLPKLPILGDALRQSQLRLTRSLMRFDLLEKGRTALEGYHIPSLDMLIALQGSWMLIERDLQVHRPFGQTGSTMVIERFLLRQPTQLIVTSYSLQYIVIF